MRLRFLGFTFAAGLCVAISGGSALSAPPLDLANPQAGPVATGEYAPGTIVIRTGARTLTHYRSEGPTMYRIGVGRPGFQWYGTHYVDRKAEWPGWTPPKQMLRRQPYLPRYMAGGPENPLGARALYLGGPQGDSGYRIHGTNDPESIGTAASSGCFRMMNEDVIKLFDHTSIGTKVVVLP